MPCVKIKYSKFNRLRTARVLWEQVLACVRQGIKLVMNNDTILTELFNRIMKFESLFLFIRMQMSIPNGIFTKVTLLRAI